jgi:aspartokinase
MRNNPIIVRKYGGACLATPAKIRAVASSLADLHSRGHRVVAIGSAMGKTTDELVKMAYQVSPHPNRRELDILLEFPLADESRSQNSGGVFVVPIVCRSFHDFGCQSVRCERHAGRSSVPHKPYLF